MKDITYPLLINGDCREVMKEIPDNSIDLTVTSPPYDNLRAYNNSSIWDETVWEDAITELYRITKDGGVVVWIVGDATVEGSETYSSFKQALFARKVGFFAHDTMIYKKNTSSYPSSENGNRYTQIFEYMFVWSKGKPITANLICDKPNKWAGTINWGKNTDRQHNGELVVKKDIKPVPEFSPRNNIWEYVVGGGFGQSDREAYEHPATAPEKLVEDHILSWSNKGDIILDCFMGSGTTGKMSVLNERKFIGIEMDEEYYKLSKKRIDKYLKRMKNFEEDEF